MAERCAKREEEKKDPLLSFAVHELRNPLAVMSGFLRMVLTHRFGPLTQEQERILGEVQKSAGKAAGLLDQLSELSRLVAGGLVLNCGSVDVPALLEEVIAALPPPDGDRDIEITFRNQAGGATVHGDARRLSRACGAVLIALRRELPYGSGLTVSLTRTARGDTRMLQVTVAADDRVDVVERLEPGQLQPLPPSEDGEFRGGVGFTLPIARLILEAHKGQLRCPLDQPKTGVLLLLPEA